MKNIDPIENDMEQLLHEKGFEELTEAEKAYVLKHIQDADEYERMRSMLMNIRESLLVEEEILPDEELKSSLMAQFEKQNGKVVYLNQNNGFFFPKGRPFYKSPALQIGMAACIVVAFIFYFPFDHAEQQGQMAQNTEVTKSGEIKPDKDKAEMFNGLSPAAEGATGERTKTMTIDGKDISVETVKEEAPAELLEQENAPVVADEADYRDRAEKEEGKKLENIPANDALSRANNAFGEVFSNNRSDDKLNKQSEYNGGLFDSKKQDANNNKDLDDVVAFEKKREEKEKTKGEDAKLEESANTKNEAYKAIFQTDVAKEADKDKKTTANSMNNAPAKIADLQSATDKGVSLDEKPELMQFLFTSL